jgi:purine-binding chemotaxis protein CheW
VDLAKLLSDGEQSAATRFVTVRTGERTVALSVDAVLGIRDIPPALQNDMPPLLRDARPDIVDAVSTLDAELLLVLRAGRLLPEEVWHLLGRQEE